MSPDPEEMSPQEFPTEKYEKITVSTKPEKLQFVYTNVVIYSYYHLAALYGIYLTFTSCLWYTNIMAFAFWWVSVLGITVGAHRLWTHRAFKAKVPLQILLMLWTSIASQGSTENWVRDHRMHHKYADTNADPHNAQRGAFFSQIGWLVVKKHSEVRRLGHTVYMDDIHSNPILMFQKRHKVLMIGFFCFLMPVLIPVYFWNETWTNAWHSNIMRFMLDVHCISLINSLAHLWGYRPYDKNIEPTHNMTATVLTMGEGFHNYHHTFPWDYRAAELGNNWLNGGALLIDFFAWIGWAYDLKTVPEDVIQARMKRTGDGTDNWGRDISKTYKADADVSS